MTVSADAPIAIGAGEEDWLAIWRQMYDAERVQTDAVAPPMREPVGDHWASQAARFAQATGRPAQPDHFMRLILPHLQPSDTVLDIGAGAGRHAVYLAQQVAQVVAVEPSFAMREQMERRLAAAPNSSVTIVPERWPDADVPACDVAICAHVVYGVREIDPFLVRMNAIARRACFILLGYRQPAYYINPFWNRVYGEPRAPLPGAQECLNVLHQLGIAAQLVHLPASRYTFADEREALADLRWRLRLPSESAHDAALHAAMRDLLDCGPEGQLMPQNQPTQVAALWWEHKV